MAIRSRNKLYATFSIASMSDLVFLLIIFFIIAAVMIAPGIIKILTSRPEIKNIDIQPITVLIDKTHKIFIEETPVSEDNLALNLTNKFGGETDGTVLLQAEKTVPVQYIVSFMDTINAINQRNGTNYKVILATLHE
jgi:biopolymer transport protein ExbD